jgi:hypothetical protein
LRLDFGGLQAVGAGNGGGPLRCLSQDTAGHDLELTNALEAQRIRAQLNGIVCLEGDPRGSDLQHRARWGLHDLKDGASQHDLPKVSGRLGLGRQIALERARFADG